MIAFIAYYDSVMVKNNGVVEWNFSCEFEKLESRCRNDCFMRFLVACKSSFLNNIKGNWSSYILVLLEDADSDLNGSAINDVFMKP